jgi:hypothetical protein
MDDVKQGKTPTLKELEFLNPLKKVSYRDSILLDHEEHKKNLKILLQGIHAEQEEIVGAKERIYKVGKKWIDEKIENDKAFSEIVKRAHMRNRIKKQ